MVGMPKRMRERGSVSAAAAGRGGLGTTGASSWWRGRGRGCHTPLGVGVRSYSSIGRRGREHFSEQKTLMEVVRGEGGVVGAPQGTEEGVDDAVAYFEVGKIALEGEDE